VYGNYTKCAITKGQWEEFFSWYKAELNRLNIEFYNPENN
jgi:hypothetical protein